VHVTHGGPVPVYQQIADIIRERIQTGRATGLEGQYSYPPGKPIPSIERIRQETGVTVKTIQHAIRILTAEGLVEVVSGIGTFVTQRED
jgi:GntR family transcriptional regulator